MWLAAPHRASRVLQLLIPPRPLLGRQVRGVGCLRRRSTANAGGTSTAAGCDRATRPFDVAADFSVKHPRPCNVGLLRRPMMTTTPRATPCCSCSSDDFVAPTLLADLSEVDELMVVLSCSFRPWTLSPLRSTTGLDLNPIFWLTILDATLVLRHGLAWASRRQNGWTCILVAFFTLSLGLLKVPFSLNDLGSIASKDDFVAHPSAFAGT